MQVELRFTIVHAKKIVHVIVALYCHLMKRHRMKQILFIWDIGQYKYIL